jgi:hypothetical protein
MKTSIDDRLRSSTSGILTTIWLLSFCICLLVPTAAHLRSGIEFDTMTAALGGIADAYSANLAVILGFYFHARLKSQKNGSRSLSSLMVAVAATLIWNGLVVGTCIASLVYLIPIEEATKTIATVAPKLSWLVAPMLGYYFASSSEKPQTH